MERLIAATSKIGQVGNRGNTSTYPLDIFEFACGHVVSELDVCEFIFFLVQFGRHSPGEHEPKADCTSTSDAGKGGTVGQFDRVFDDAP